MFARENNRLRFVLLVGLGGLGYPEVGCEEGDFCGCVGGFDDYVDAFKEVAWFGVPCLVDVVCDVEGEVCPLVEGYLGGFVFDDVGAFVDDVAVLVYVACGVVLGVGGVVEVEFCVCY